MGKILDWMIMLATPLVIYVLWFIFLPTLEGFWKGFAVPLLFMFSLLALLVGFGCFWFGVLNKE